MKVTLDTNVLVSGTFWSGDSFKVLDAIDKKKLSCNLSKEILEEYYDVIKREEIVEKIRDKALIISEVSRKVIENATIVDPKEAVDVVKEDPDDNKILACALEGNSEYLITNDNHLLKLKIFKGIKIITPTEFVKKKGDIFKEEIITSTSDTPL